MTKKEKKKEHEEIVRKQKITLMTIIVFLLCVSFFAMGIAVGSVAMANQLTEHALALNE